MVGIRWVDDDRDVDVSVDKRWDNDGNVIGLGMEGVGLEGLRATGRLLEVGEAGGKWYTLFEWTEIGFVSGESCLAMGDDGIDDTGVDTSVGASE